ncbi:hypothetical protein BGX38DRAFT_1144645 [Terfezia claveryi]|nr:hypothetical protein BGX38DRAFT_1144645 [Terfezia claveryi]
MTITIHHSATTTTTTTTTARKMSEAMMPISTDALHYRTLLFELSKPVTIPAEKFDEIWPEELQCNGTVWVEEQGGERNARRMIGYGPLVPVVELEALPGMQMLGYLRHWGIRNTATKA